LRRRGRCQRSRRSSAELNELDRIFLQDIDSSRISHNIAFDFCPLERLKSVDRTRTFAVVLEPEEEGGFTVRVPSLPEIVTYGKDEGEALAMVEDAIRLVLEDCAARGEPIPNGEPPRIREVTVTLAA
jgi:antitoxin HicB